VRRTRYFGLAIGAVILASDNFFAKLSGGMFNPGVASGICAVSLFNSQSGIGLWMYWVRGAVYLCCGRRVFQGWCWWGGGGGGKRISNVVHN
jgi:hypothetical protein